MASRALMAVGAARGERRTQPGGVAPACGAPPCSSSSATRRSCRCRWPPSSRSAPDAKGFVGGLDAVLGYLVPRPAARDRDPGADRLGPQRHPRAPVARRRRVTRGLIGPERPGRDLRRHRATRPMLERPSRFNGLLEELRLGRASAGRVPDRRRRARDGGALGRRCTPGLAYFASTPSGRRRGRRA